MAKRQLSEFINKIDKSKEVIVGNNSLVFTLLDGRFLKIYNKGYIELAKLVGADIEKKILNKEKKFIPKENIKPEVIVYDGENFIGEVTRPARGISYSKWNDSLSIEQISDLRLHGTIYSNLEGIVKSTPDIVYPDLCSYDNIFIDGTNIELIDYEGLQIGPYTTLSMSSAIGDRSLYNSSKKYTLGNNLFTKELDIKSLIFFYFRTVFDLDLKLIDEYAIDVETFFRAINLNDPDIMHKVWKLFQEKEKNEYLGEDVFRIAENYNMDIYPDGIRRLVRK